MTIKKFNNYLLISILLFIISPLISFGQTTSGGNTLGITIDPKNPEPFQSVKLKLSSLSYDLDRSKIAWFMDGVEKRTEIGLKEVTAQAGKSGKKTTIKARVETTDGQKEVEISFIPAVVDLIYESASFTPPFYKGRALNPNQGDVRVTAIADLVRSNGVKIPNKNIVYSWKIDGKAPNTTSALGENILSFSGSLPIRDTNIEVTATSFEGDISATKQINITNYPPEIIFYENNPIYGIMFNQAVKNTIKMVSDEFKISAFPYFMSVGYAESPDLNYTWSINGQVSENLDGDKAAMLFRQGEAGAGTANINLKIENISKIFQFIDNGFVINFEKQ